MLGKDGSLMPRTRCYEVLDEKNGHFIVVFPDIPYWIVANRWTLFVLDHCNGNRRVEEIAAALRDYCQISSLDSFGYVTKILATLNTANALDTEKLQETPMPGSILIENFIDITSACNLRCRHCAVSASAPLPDELTTQEIKEYLKDCSEIKAPNGTVTFSGGEPLVRQLQRHDLFELIDFAHELGFHELTLATNGLLITAELAEEFASRCKYLNVQVSLDGDKESHEWLRGEGTWERTLFNIKLLAEKGASVHLSMCVHHKNVDKILSLIRTARELGVKRCGFLRLSPLGRALSNQLQYVPVHEIVKLLREHHAELKGMAIGAPIFGPTMTLRKCVRCRACGIGYQGFYLKSNGDLYSCIMASGAETLKLGNIRQKSALEIWASAPPLSILRTLHVDSMNSTCSRCSVRYFCGGGCRAKTFLKTGDIRAPSVDCDDIRKTLIECIWMLKENPDFLKRETDLFYNQVRKAMTCAA